MSKKKASIHDVTEMTAKDLRTVAKNISSQKLSRLTLPEVEAVVQLVSKIMPAGNVPGMILSGLARLPGRKIPIQKLKQDVNALFSGVEQVLDQAVYGAFFAGPAAVLWAYQNLLKLAGKDPESAFPEGAWQFYVDYALREDTARHANETHGFDTLLKQNHIYLDEVDRLTAWVMASMTCLHQYHALLENEWMERVSISLLEDALRSVPEQTQTARRLFRDWELVRPYRREDDGASMDYPTYRRLRFDKFLQKKLKILPPAIYDAWNQKLNEAIEQGLSAYQNQMSILAYLDPGHYGEIRIPFNITDAQIGIIHNNSYYLIPACESGTNKPLSVLTARAQIMALLNDTSAVQAQLISLAKVKRSALAHLRSKLNPMLVTELDNLRFAPILISTDRRARELPLSELRQAERGIGSHAMTIFDTGHTIVFDQSHIFFDGVWGSVLSEIMTNEALSWARYLSLLPSPTPADYSIYASLALQLNEEDLFLVSQSPHVLQEAGAENNGLNLKAFFDLRKQFKQRSDLIELTINDLLVLYRAIHATSYQPSQELLNEIRKLSETQPELSASLHQLVEEGSRTNPSILIPMDASLKSPRERVYPMNVEVPLVDLNLLALHAQTLKLLNAYETASSEDRAALFASFNHSQKVYLASLAGFGVFLSRAKEIASLGQSASVGAIKLLAHLPLPIQRLLDKIPERFEVLNNIIKGREVFSNVGAVAPTSTLTRFMTAKDDNEQKQLAWSVITDSESVVKMNLRDFRPHVSQLLEIGRKDLAEMITQDYLDAYVNGANRFVNELSKITMASRETLVKGKIKVRSNE
ncbi:MAG: hypothetical protein JNK81_02780 [Anaerolineales bacterium]|nr:hypothetical protein [Anaerolineales bacterium]